MSARFTVTEHVQPAPIPMGPGERPKILPEQEIRWLTEGSEVHALSAVVKILENMAAKDRPKFLPTTVGISIDVHHE